MVDKLLEIDDLVIPPNDTSVSGFVYNLIKDWYSGPTGDPQNERRDVGDGWFGEEEMDYNGLVVSFEGVCVDNDPISLFEKKARFASLRNNGRDVTVAVTDPLGRTTRTGKVLATPIPHTRSLASFRWAIDIQCDDPLRYGEEVTDYTGIPVADGGLTWPITWPITWLGGGNDGRITLTNTGKAPTFPIFEVDGGTTLGFRLDQVGTGQSLWLDRLVPEGSKVTLDAKTERVTLDGANNDISASLAYDDWWSVGPGETMVVQYVPLGTVSGTPGVTGKIRPAFN